MISGGKLSMLWGGADGIGNLISVFFITQFFTSLLWSSIADRHGRRAVIVASMAGSAIALVIFGTSESVCKAA